MPSNAKEHKNGRLNHYNVTAVNLFYTNFPHNSAIFSNSLNKSMKYICQMTDLENHIASSKIFFMEVKTSHSHD